MKTRVRRLVVYCKECKGPIRVMETYTPRKKAPRNEECEACKREYTVRTWVLGLRLNRF